jgi:hypothetical protein
MGFDWETYCLQWLSVILGVAFVWPLIGICIDIFGADYNE